MRRSRRLARRNQRHQIDIGFAVEPDHVGQQPAAESDVDEAGIAAVRIDRRQRAALQVGIDHQHALRRRSDRGAASTSPSALRRHRRRRRKNARIAGRRLARRATRRRLCASRGRKAKPDRRRRRRPNETSASGSIASTGTGRRRRPQAHRPAHGRASCRSRGGRSDRPRRRHGGRTRTRPVPAAPPNIIAPSAMIRLGGGELRRCGRSALVRTRIFLVSSCSCSPVSRARARNACRSSGWPAHRVRVRAGRPSPRWSSIAACLSVSKLPASVCSLALALSYSVRAVTAARSTSSSIMC